MSWEDSTSAERQASSERMAYREMSRATELGKENAKLRARVTELEMDMQAITDDNRRIEDASKCPGDVDMLDHVELLAAEVAEFRAKELKEFRARV